MTKAMLTKSLVILAVTRGVNQQNFSVSADWNMRGLSYRSGGGSYMGWEGDVIGKQT